MSTVDRITPQHWWSRLIKRQLFPRVDAIITTGPDGQAFVQRYGEPKIGTFAIGHTFNVEHFAAIQSHR